MADQDHSKLSSPQPPPFLEVACKGLRKTTRFAAGTKAGFAVSLINRKLDNGFPPVSHIEAVKAGEEPISFGPDAVLVDYGNGWKLQTVAEYDNDDGITERIGRFRPVRTAAPNVVTATSADDDIDVVSNGTEQSEKYLRWPREMDKLLLDVLKEEKAKRSKDVKHFDRETWNNVIAVLNVEFQKFGKKIEKAKALNRLKTIQKLTSLAHKLLYGESGFRWNNNTKIIEATPSVWERAVKMKPENKLVRGKELYFLEDAFELFEKYLANGGKKNLKEKVHGWQMEQDLPSEDNDEALNNEIYVDELDLFGSSLAHSAMVQDNASSVPGQMKATSRGDKRKKPMSDSTGDEIMEVGQAKHMYTAIEIRAELKKLALSKWEVMDALDFLKDNERLIDSFFACDDDIKLLWLQRKMGIKD